MSEIQEPVENDYKSYVGPIDRYDFMGATQFRLLTSLGLRAHHHILDFGCGSLRAGKLLIPYLDAGHYHGQDPNQWLIDDGISHELGHYILELKQPHFSNRADFEVGFDRQFDFIVAQSIFSHTGLFAMRKGLGAILNALDLNGIALFTIIEGDDYSGTENWLYPECTTFAPKTIEKLLDGTGGYWRRLWWFHPAQTWFVMSKRRQRLPSAMDSFFLLGGEEAGSSQYARQNFLANRLFSFGKRHQRLKKLLPRLFM